MPTLVPYEQVVEITREIEKSMEWRSITFEEMPTARKDVLTQLAGEVVSIGDYVKRMIPQVGSVDQGILNC